MLLRAVDGAVRPRRGERRLENVLLLPGRPERGTALPGCSLCQHGRSLSSWASRAWGWTAGAGAGPRLCPRRRSATRIRRCAGKWPRECRPCRWVQPQPNAMAAPPGRGGGARGCGALAGPWRAARARRPRWAGARARSRRRRGAAGPEQARRGASPGPGPRVPAPRAAEPQAPPRPRARRAPRWRPEGPRGGEAPGTRASRDAAGS